MGLRAGYEPTCVAVYNNKINNNNNIITIININLIYIAQFDTIGILTALYIVIT